MEVCGRGHIQTTENRTADGRHCRLCVNERMRARRAGVELEPIARTMYTHCVAGHEFTPENTYIGADGARQCNICRRDRSLESWWRHRDQRLAEQAVWREANREVHNERSRRWQHENPEKSNMISRLKKQRRRAAGVLTEADWALVLEIYGTACLKCGSDAPPTIDHIDPVIDGGANLITNVQPLCGPCNSSKGPTYADYRPFPIEMVLGLDVPEQRQPEPELTLF
jgi:5-methylcytosine-specific restriction endonuclease McrA